MAEAVAALVETFADVSGAQPVGSEEFQVPAGPDEDMLVAVLDQVVYLMTPRVSSRCARTSRPPMAGSAYGSTSWIRTRWR